MVNEIQVDQTDSSMTAGEDDDSVGWRSLPEILESSDEGDTCNSDDKEWLHENFYKQEHMTSCIEYAKLKFSTMSL